MNSSTLIERIDAALPQTQCTRCGYPTCLAYAEAIARGVADIDQCPPGGEEGVGVLALLLDRAPKPLNPANGTEAPPDVAFIDEDLCIGCTKCIDACPVDAIVGAAKRMHTIIAAECTGCGLCLPPCPVDCIALLRITALPLARTQVLARAAQARARFDARAARIGAESSDAMAAKAVTLRVQSFSSQEGSGRDGVEHRATGAMAAAAPAVGSSGTSPITRSAVLEAIARGKARRRENVKDPPTR